MKKIFYFIIGSLFLIQTPTAFSGISTIQFDQGTSTSFVDAFNGTAGSGWLTPWVVKTNDSGNTTALSGTVISTSPLTTGSGNYLNASFTSIGTTLYSGVSRQYDQSEVGTSHLISFDWRPETTLAANQYFTIFGAPSANYATGPNESWAIRISTGGWYLYGKSGGGEYTLNTSAMPIVTNNTYHFSIAVDDAAKTYVVTLSTNVSGTPYTFTSSTLTYRSTSSFSNVDSYIIFATVATASGETLGFSVDNLSIASIPEIPSSLSLVFGVLMIGMAFATRAKFSTAA